MINHRKYIALSTIVILLVMTACSKSNDSEGKVIQKTNTNAHNYAKTSQKEVHLNKAQIKNAEIKLGWFDMKNLNEVIHANGYTKLPPQNEADISVYTNGVIKDIMVIEGEYVKKGQTLAVIESPEITELQRNYLVSKSNLAYLKLEYNRQKVLSDQDMNAKKVVQKTKSELEIEEANFNALKSQLKLLKVDADGETITKVPVKAPISGNITEVFIKIGSAVEASKTLFSIVDNSEMHVDLLVYEKDLNQIKVGQDVRFVLTNQSNQEIVGKIFNIGKSFENETKTVAVHADIISNKTTLIPGMYVNALIDAGSNEVRTLPEPAIISAEGRDFVFITSKHHGHNHGEHSHNNDETVYKRVEVKTGATQLGYTQVTPLVKIPKGYKLVINGAYYLQSHLQKSESGGGHGHAH